MRNNRNLTKIITSLVLGVSGTLIFGIRNVSSRDLKDLFLNNN